MEIHICILKHATQTRAAIRFIIRDKDSPNETILCAATFMEFVILIQLKL